MKKSKVWIVVTAERGFPSSVGLYRTERSALSAKRRFENRMNPDYDEVEDFVIDLKEFERKGRLYVEA